MAFRVLKEGNKITIQLLEYLNGGRCWHLHLSDGVPNAAELGKFIDAFFFDDCAVHVEADRICSPEQFLGLIKSCHHAGKRVLRVTAG